MIVNPIIAMLMTITATAILCMPKTQNTPYIITAFLFITIFYFTIAAIETPKFYQYEDLIKRKEKNARKKHIYIDFTKEKAKIEKLYKAGKIDGMEREYLYQRMKSIEPPEHTGNPVPKYAAGGEMDKL